MNAKELKEIIENHGAWLSGEGSGQRANLWGANLRGANLRCANLWGANLEDANLWGANLEGANLRGANLLDANLEDANLEGASLRDANLEGANLRGANLRGANLEGANLEGANLEGANLWGVAGNRKEIKSIFSSEQYPITYTAEYLQIGCQRHLISDWWEFDDRRILEMDGRDALKFWREWRDAIRVIIEKSPAAKCEVRDND
jgi:hypothetical protein